MPFFTEEDMKSEINTLRKLYPDYNENDIEHEKLIRYFNHSILKDISDNPESYDKTLEFMLENDNLNFKELINHKNNTNNQTQWLPMFTALFRIACAMEFHGKIYTGSLQYRPFQNIIDNIDSFPDNLKRYITNERYQIGYDLFKQILLSDHGKATIDFKKRVEEFSTKKNEAIKALDELKEEVKAIQKNLNTLKQGFKFVELNDGFDRLKREKERSENYSLALLTVISIAMLAIPIYIITDLLQTPNNTALNMNYAMRVSIPTFAIEIFSFYLFRITYSNYQSIKKQLLQINLRMTLIQFIQAYSDYAQPLKTNGNTALEKFENLIFSSIIMDDQQLPSAFDGFEQISKLISATKGKSG